MNAPSPVRAGRAALPAVDRVLRAAGAAALIERHGRALVVEAARDTLAVYRGRGDGASVKAIVASCGGRVAQVGQTSHRRYFNVTAPVLLTNLGRPPLPEVV